MGAITTTTEAQLRIIRQTMAADLNDPEFNLFMARCQSTGLDPFKRQMCAVVYNKDKPDKRKVTFITEINGYRSLAERAGNYRPAESDDDEVLVTDDAAKDPLINPQGIVSATYYAHKQDSLGLWHRVRGKVYWEEYAPITDEWAYDQDAGKRKPTGKQALQGGNWVKMGRHMLMKCAESHALRKGWPDEIPGDTYTREEMSAEEAREKYDLDLSATEVLEQGDKQFRQQMLGGPSVSLLWAPGTPLEGVPMGRVADRCYQHIDEQTDPEALLAWQDTNAVGLRQFWAENKSDALAIKQYLAKKVDALTKEKVA